MKFIPETSRIEFKRGDDDALLVALKDGKSFTPGFDRVFFSLKTNPTDLVDIFQVEALTFVPYLDVVNAAALIEIPHENTIGLELGVYYYDVLIQWGDGGYLTIIEPTKLILIAGGSHGSI